MEESPALLVISGHQEELSNQRVEHVPDYLCYVWPDFGISITSDPRKNGNAAANGDLSKLN